VKDALEDGRLVRVLPPERDLLSTKVHVVRWPARLAGSAHVDAFAKWISVQAHGAVDSSMRSLASSMPNA
jgi:LysR family glycine cleavage system transcriptional activator